jgi:hypothetical protein
LDSEGDEEDGYSDLDDFIVCQQDRDYPTLLSVRFRDCGGVSSSSEEEDEEEEDQEEA